MKNLATKGNVENGIQASWDALIVNFIMHKRAQKVSQRTEDDYKYHIRLFAKRTGVTMQSYDCLEQAVRLYFADSRQLSPATYNTRRKTLNAFFKWAKGKKIIPANPIEEIPIKKQKESFQPKAIDEELAIKLLGLCDRSNFCGIRDFALIMLQLDTGIRPGEALKLTAGHFDFRARTVDVTREIAKDKELRILPISKATIAAVKEVIMAHSPKWNEATPIFCSQRGTELQEKSWAKIMRIKYSPKLGKKVTPYDLRHSFAITSLLNGANLSYVGDMLGHSSLEITRRYCVFTNKQIAQQHSMSSPINALKSRARVA